MGDKSDADNISMASCTIDPSLLELDGANLAKHAVQHDTNGAYSTAIFYYNEAGQALLSASLAGSKMPNIVDKANEYILRAETLKNMVDETSAVPQAKSQLQLDTDRGQFLLTQAFDEDAAGETQDAMELYMDAAELFLKIRDASTDKGTKDKVSKLAVQALDRVETLKKQQAKPPPTTTTPSAPSKVTTKSGQSVPPLGFNFLADEASARGVTTSEAKGVMGSEPSVKSTPSKGGLINVGPNSYAKEEIAVLRKTSFVNNREYVPFMSVDMKEKFAYPVSFNDKDGKLVLSPQQSSHFGRWVRLNDLCDDPKMIVAVSCYSIKQTIVSDCSFISSLAISAQYERRFKKKLITSIIYPQNRNGEPLYNPCGKYMIKLHINGIHRKIIIDDYLPLGRDNELLCSYSVNRNEFWVSLLEKAYLKVMGGYDFPGSNSNIDLHALTGWIPERLSIDPKSPEFDKDKEFQRLHDRFHKGHCLVTVATGVMSEGEADRAGLVPTHAYAMLDIREVKGIKLLMLKNPWRHLRWKGRYSENDAERWTPDLMKALNYDPKSAQNFDNGVFWIDLDSLCHFFDVFYINWNPELFTHTTCIHNTWLAKDGPVKDSYNMSDNPQFLLNISAAKSSAVWILLTRHITDKDDFANNREFITVLVYKNEGKKVFYPYSPKPYKDGVRINSPLYLCKLVQPAGDTQYTLVISQYAKNNTLHYTLRVFSTCPFKLTKISDPYKKEYHKKVTGQWKGPSAAGCPNYRESYHNNPIYQLNIDNNSSTNQIMLELSGPRTYSVGFNTTMVTENVPNAPGSFKKMSSGDYRSGYSMQQLENIPGGVYNIQPSTFLPGQEGPFFLEVSSSAACTLKQLQ